jgi:4-alpha-glucanotransferase
LGMIPSCVPRAINELQILSLEIQRMPKSQEMEFGHPDHYPYLSVATTSTHDMSTIRGWWEEDASKTQRYFNLTLGRHGLPPAFANSEICEAIVEAHLWSPAMLVILPFQDWLSMDEGLRRNNPADERINVPANPRHYWNYRMHISLEELIKSKGINKQIAGLINKTGR